MDVADKCYIVSAVETKKKKDTKSNALELYPSGSVPLGFIIRQEPYMLYSNDILQNTDSI